MRQKLERAKGKQDEILNQIELSRKEIQEKKEHLVNCEKARLIIDIVSLETQSQLEYRLNELVTLAMLAVFREQAYKLKMRFDIKRGRTEASPLFTKEDKERRPLYGTGFGISDVGSFALRPTLWSLEEPKKRPFFFLDEPFRHLNDPEKILHRRAAEMVKEISKKLDVQIVIITQNETLCEAGDVIFKIDQKRNGHSFIR